MRLIRSLFAALMVTIMTTIAGSVITHLFDETSQAQSYIASLVPFIGNTAHAAGMPSTEDDIQTDANHTFTTSLNTHTPSTVIDEDDLSTPTNNQSQSPEQEVTDDYVYEDILSALVPISSEYINYEKVLGLEIEQIKTMMERGNLTIWDIAEQQKETNLLEDAFYAAYPARIIDLLEQGIISQSTADILIAQSTLSISEHTNVSVEEMLENLLNQD